MTRKSHTIEKKRDQSFHPSSTRNSTLSGSFRSVQTTGATAEAIWLLCKQRIKAEIQSFSQPGKFSEHIRNFKALISKTNYQNTLLPLKQLTKLNLFLAKLRRYAQHTLQKSWKMQTVPCRAKIYAA